MAKFFTSPNDLSMWVKKLGAKKAATVLVNIPKVGEANAKDIVETTRRVAEANDKNAAEVLYDILKSAGIVEADVDKSESGVDQLQVANDLLEHKVISKDEHGQMVRQAQIMRQPGQYDMPLRICPKLPWSVGKKLISTYNCRHYCLDGIVLDDDPARVYCGELLWRRHMMDKFSHEWQDRKTGEWIGGYVNDRFFKFPDAGTPGNPDVPRDGGNPMSLKPGERTRTPRPHQWSLERRMQEAREKGSTSDHMLGKKASAGEGGWVEKMIEAQRSGGYVDFSFDAAGNLVMTPNEDGIKEAQDYVNHGNTTDNAFIGMIDDHLANGWRIVPPEEIGALTSALILVNESEIEGTVWSNIDFYQVRSELQDFAEGKSVTWTKHAGPEDKTASARGKTVEATIKSVKACAMKSAQSDGEKCPMCQSPLEVDWEDGDWLGEIVSGSQSGWTEYFANCTGCRYWKKFRSSEGGEVKVVQEYRPQNGSPVQTSASAISLAKKVILAAGAGSMTKLSSAVVEATSGEESIVKAFSMAVDLHNDNVDDVDAVLKIAEATGIPITKAVVIQATAVRKLASHVSDVYAVEPDKKPVPKVKSDKEVQQDAAELGLTQDQP